MNQMIPTDQNMCGPEDPDTFAVWALRRLPAPIRTGVSRDLWEAGFRHHPDLQTVKYETDPSFASLGAHAPAMPVKVTKDAVRERLAEVDPELAQRVAAAETDPEERARLLEAGRLSVEHLVAMAEKGPEKDSRLSAIQRVKLAQVRDALGSTLGE